MAEAREIMREWSEAPPLAECVRAYLGVGAPTDATADRSFDMPLGPEMTSEQYERLIGTMTANAAAHGLRKPHG